MSTEAAESLALEIMKRHANAVGMGYVEFQVRCELDPSDRKPLAINIIAMWPDERQTRQHIRTKVEPHQRTETMCLMVDELSRWYAEKPWEQQDDAG